MVRTQIYLEKRQYRALKREAKLAGASMTALLRQLIDTHLLGRKPQKGSAKEPILSLIGIGASGQQNTSENVDGELRRAFGG